MKNLLLFKWMLCIFILLPLCGFAQDEILVSDRMDNAVNRYDLNGNFLGVFIQPNAGGISNPQDIVFRFNGNILMTGLGNDAIKEYDGSGNYIGDFSSGYALQGPTRMEIHMDYIYVLQWTPNYKVVRFNLDGTFDREFTNSGVFQSIGLAWDMNENLYVASYGQGTNGMVTYFDNAGMEIGPFIDSSVLQGTTNIWFEPNGTGNLLALDFNANRMSRFDPNGNFIDHPITGIVNPEGYMYLPNSGNLLICERGADKVTEFDPNFGLIGRWDDPAGDLSRPNFIRLRPPNFSIPDVAVQQVLVTPTVGDIFYFNQELSNEFESVDVYSLQGRHIDTFNLDQNNVMDFSTYTEGMYFLVAKSSTGGTATQKIVVNR